MEIVFSPQALEDLEFWRKSGNKQIQKKIESLITDISQNPFQGLGQPEQLKYGLSGLWSRRIDKEHRLIYEIQENLIEITSLKGHYI